MQRPVRAREFAEGLQFSFIYTLVTLFCLGLCPSSGDINGLKMIHFYKHSKHLKILLHSETLCLIGRQKPNSQIYLECLLFCRLV
jgi:hypothetical protein